VLWLVFRARTAPAGSAADPRGVARRHPEVAAHLRSCGPCAEDLEGLLAAIKADLEYPGAG
jgi:hypothetical protein